ncbi:hypothetical protein Hypma_007585 [Hypsizygus marmoreus]|uniref:Uncharacterized protein n=1 Tax=Hypsizygus marmoreus TaxID=39966 RepID=A0A369JRD1_HYPMA|nr:hypothetical protein Hypma_007585 [Hypsizygus marmoreus]
MPYPVKSIHIGRKVGQVPELIDYHNQQVQNLEVVLKKYLSKRRQNREATAYHSYRCIFWIWWGAQGCHRILYSKAQRDRGSYRVDSNQYRTLEQFEDSRSNHMSVGTGT